MAWAARKHPVNTDPDPDPDLALPSRGDGDARRRDIAEVAYGLAERRGFAPGHELEDWLAAEREVDARRADAAHRRQHG